MEKVYFIGEYGFAFRQVLPFLENYKYLLEIITWSPLCKIINLLWPNRYITIEAEPLIDGLDGTRRSNIWYVLNENTKDFKAKGFEGYNEITVLDPNSEYIYSGGFYKFKTLSQKITFGEQKKEKPYVSIFPRKRDRCPWKNNINNIHVEWLIKNYPNKEIVGHGLPEERIDLGIRYCKDIYEQINTLNNSETFICPDSGMADLGLLCGCDLILTGNYLTIEQVNPHKCSIKYWNRIKK